MKMTQHLTLRVAWHDSKWNGQVCAEPSANSFCVMLDRVRVERNEMQEDSIRGKSWTDLSPEQLPPCKAESGIFMNPTPWRRRFKHSYVKIKSCKEKNRSSLLLAHGNQNKENSWSFDKGEFWKTQSTINFLITGPLIILRRHLWDRCTEDVRPFQG